jgi:uncharacterized protein YfaS (alpha-2-macroglobulin family)
MKPVATKVSPLFGGLQVTTSSTALQSLTDAAVFLYSYPYECSEQIASKLMGLLPLRDVLYTFSGKNEQSCCDRSNSL